MDDGRNNIVEWENGTRVACNNRAINLHSCISVTDKVKINEQNTSIATGPLYHTPKLMRFERSYLKLGRFRTSWGIRPRNVGTVLVQDTKVYFTHRIMV